MLDCLDVKVISRIILQLSVALSTTATCEPLTIVRVGVFFVSISLAFLCSLHQWIHL